MALPKKEYFSLEEVAERWGTTVADLKYYAVNGHLEVSAFLLRAYIEAGRFVKTPEGQMYPQLESRHHVRRGLQPIRPDDLEVIFKKGQTVVTAFKPEEGEDWRDVCDDGSESYETELTISRDDLFITRAERDRFEQANEIEPSVPRKHAPKPQVEDEGYVEPNRYRTGLPGRPTSRHLFDGEFQRRVATKEYEQTLVAEARALAKWLEREHPDGPRATAKTIANHIRHEYNKLFRKNAQN